MKPRPLIATAALCLAPHAEAWASGRHCHETSESGTVGFASCRRFGDWDYEGGLAASLGIGMVYRVIPMPSEIDLCTTKGKSCPTVGTAEGIRPDSKHALAGEIDVSLFSLGPARFGLAVGAGGAGGNVRGLYGLNEVQAGSLFFWSFGFTAGLSMGVGPLGLRAEGIFGVEGLQGDAGVKSPDGQELSLLYTFPQVEGRATVSYFLDRWISVALFGGYGLRGVEHGGLMLRFHMMAYDGGR